MTASREERSLRKSSKKCVKGESKTRLLEVLVKKKTGVREVEEFVRRERKTFMGGNNDRNSRICKYKEERKIVENIMRRKLRGNIKHCNQLRREKIMADKNLVKTLGGKTGEYRRVDKEIKKDCDELRRKLSMKNEKKIEWLSKKYGQNEVVEEDLLSAEEREKYGNCEIFMRNCKLDAEELREPEIVRGNNEIVEITNEEKKLLVWALSFVSEKT